MFVDREKRSVNSGDEPGLKNQVVSDPSGITAALKSVTDSSIGNNGGYVPTVGRWGNEWPSWLEDTSLGEQRRLSHGTQPNDGVCRNRNVSSNRALAQTNTVTSKWPSRQLASNRCHVNVVGAHSDMVTADDIANQLQFLLKTKWTIDEDTYNADAFDQCEGAWPIAHPLPLPLWSNALKQPFIVENVSYFFIWVLFRKLKSNCFFFLDLAIWRSCRADWCNSTSTTGGNTL